MINNVTRMDYTYVSTPIHGVQLTKELREWISDIVDSTNMIVRDGLDAVRCYVEVLFLEDGEGCVLHFRLSSENDYTMTKRRTINQTEESYQNEITVLMYAFVEDCTQRVLNGEA